MASVEEQIRALQSQIDALRMQQRPRGIAAPLSTPMGGTVDYSAGFTLFAFLITSSALHAALQEFRERQRMSRKGKDVLTAGSGSVISRSRY